ncbi:MAG: cellulase family glycosylhydrolase [Acidobacteria bacterium]|nr:cellulase family glycosylhydrolase [Acidobacteriota bacterium]
MKRVSLLIPILSLTLTSLPVVWGGTNAIQPDKWALWVGGTQLRGANIYQRRVYPELDGPDFLGPGPLGPPYTQQDFNRLAALGANYVNVSHPGLFREKPPYTPDQDVQNNLDRLLDLIARAGLFAVISFRTGPGRSEFTFFRDGAGVWFDPSYLNESVWQDRAAQEAWAAMWRYTAERYRTNPLVVGYDLMVEPNANALLDIYDPEEFYATYANSLYDWNQLHPRLSAAIRSRDSQTPILTGSMSYSSLYWLPYVKLTNDPRTIYTVHQYEPFQYTHQEPDRRGRLPLTYPGRFDIDGDGVRDEFNRAWLEQYLSAINEFTSTQGVPVAINEFGAMRWEPGGDTFMDDQMDLLEQRGINHALWLWESSWEPLAEEDAFNFRHGPNPNNHIDVAFSELIGVIVKYWGRNTIRP